MAQQQHRITRQRFFYSKNTEVEDLQISISDKKKYARSRISVGDVDSEGQTLMYHSACKQSYLDA